ncbi:MAG: hypothetical protein I8H71_01315 [Xanthomonadaceae bacterium]|nr:hypothetical protein [Xanthomonadaceae bacterium]
MGYDFTNLSMAQQWLLTNQGWERGPNRGTGPRRKTVALLIDRGLLIEHKAESGRPDAFEVPLSVHIAWCEHCAGLEC